MRGAGEPSFEIDFPPGSDMLREIREGPKAAERMEFELFSRLAVSIVAPCIMIAKFQMLTKTWASVARNSYDPGDACRARFSTCERIMRGIWVGKPRYPYEGGKKWSGR